jgi:hypothetical protein
MECRERTRNLSASHRPTRHGYDRRQEWLVSPSQQFPGAKQLYVLSDAQNLVTFRIVLTESQEAWRKRKKENRVNII